MGPRAGACRCLHEEALGVRHVRDGPRDRGHHLLGGSLLHELATVLSASGESWASLLGSQGIRLMLALPLTLDDLWMLLDPHSQTLHDKLAGTYVLTAGRAR